MKYRAVFFDMDGLALDTEPLHMTAWNKTLSKYRINFNEKQYSEFVGMGDYSMAELVVKRYGIKETLDVIVKKKGAIYMRLLDSVKVFPGILRLIHYLNKRKIPYGLVSSQSRKYIVGTLRYSKLARAFPIVLGREDVHKTKPAPDVYVLASKKVGIPASECIALEDSDTGLNAAKRAGMCCIGIKHSFASKKKFIDADYIFDSLEQAVPHIIKMLKGAK